MAARKTRNSGLTRKQQPRINRKATRSKAAAKRTQREIVKEFDRATTDAASARKLLRSKQGSRPGAKPAAATTGRPAHTGISIPKTSNQARVAQRRQRGGTRRP